MQNTDTKEVDAQYRQRIGKCRMQTTQGKCTNVQYKNTEVNVQFRQQRDTCTLDNTEVILNLQLINKTSRPDFYRLQHDL